MPARLLVLVVLLSGSFAVAACGGDDRAGRSGRALTVVATTTQATDLVRNVAGERAEVVGLLPANADPHDYEVRPDDVKALVDADLVVRSGGDLDEWLQGAIESSGTDAPELVLIDRVSTLAGGDEEIDPHWWQDPRNGVEAVAAIAAALAEADPDGAAGYESRADDYARRLTALDGAVAACVDALPADRRKLVTTHDALGYYAKRYGLEVVGTVIPSRSTQSQASAGELAELVATIRREQVKAIFAESSVNAKVERAVAQDAGATVGKALWADTLGPAGSDGDTYLKSLAANTRAIVGGLGGGRVTCRLPA